MAWLRIDDNFDSHPKVLALGPPLRRWTWMRVLVYTCRYRSRIVPDNIRDTIPDATKSFLKDAETLGLIDRDSQGHMVVHDWDKYQAGDPAKALRQAKWRNKQPTSVDANVEAAVDGLVDASRVGAPARPVPSPTPEGKDVLSSDNAAAVSEDDAAALLRDLKAAGWRDWQVAKAKDEPARAMAWLERATTENADNPGGFSWAGFDSGTHPTTTQHGPRRTGFRYVRGQAGATYVRDPEGTDTLPSGYSVPDTEKVNHRPVRAQAESWVRNAGWLHAHPADAIAEEYPTLPQNDLKELTALALSLAEQAEPRETVSA